MFTLIFALYEVKKIIFFHYNKLTLVGQLFNKTIETCCKWNIMKYPIFSIVIAQLKYKISNQLPL